MRVVIETRCTKKRGRFFLFSLHCTFKRQVEKRKEDVKRKKSELYFPKSRKALLTGCFEHSRFWNVQWKSQAGEGPKNTLRKIGPFFRDAEVTTDVNLISQIQVFLNAEVTTDVNWVGI